jgi:uroporphyrinogen-III decarboxylase
MRADFLKIFRGQRPEKTPWAADLTYWRDSQILQGRLPGEYRGPEGFLKLHLDLGVMPYYIYSLEEETAWERPRSVAAARKGRGCVFAQQGRGISAREGRGGGVSVHQIGGIGRPYNGVFSLSYDGVDAEKRETGNVVETVFHLSGRSLRQKKAYLPMSFCYAFEEYPVKTAGDLDVLRAIVERLRFAETYDEYRALASRWGEWGVPIAPLPRSPLSSLIVDWMGLENFVFANADYPGEIRRTIDCIDRANDAAFEIVLGSPAEILHFCDNLSASNFASYFDEYASEYYTRRFAQLHARGKKAAVHIDGSLRGLLGRMAGTGADCIEAFTPKPVGDLEIRELWGEAGRKDVVLWGGLPGVMFTPHFRKEDLRRQVSALFAEVSSRGPFIAGSADQIPPDADLDYVRFVSDLLAGGE